MLCFSSAALGLDNGLALTPQMGYNSWYDLMGSITEENIKATTDDLISTGLYDVGYNFINLDDDWAERNKTTGKIIADPQKWTGGSLKTIADYVHSKGLKFGTYTDRGTLTCGGRPAAQGHEDEDAAVYASWGVDYLKEDSCHASGDQKVAFQQYGKMRDALNKTGRPIVFSLCGWNPWYAPVGKTLGNSWRIGPDDTNWGGVLKNIDINAPLSEYAGPGGWNDPCLLLSTTYTNQQRVTEKQSRSQFSMWAVMASPLLISGNIRNMSAYTLATYMNKEVIAVSQDALGKQGTRIQGGPLSSDSHASNGAHTAECTGSKTQQWTFRVGGKYDAYLINNGTGLALNSDNCQEDLIYYKPVTGSTCHGKSGKDCDNLRFQYNSPSPGMISTPMNGECVSESSPSGKAQMQLKPCVSGMAEQVWAYDTDKLALTNKASGMCLEGAKAAETGGGTNIWARPLVGGSVAAVFLNTNSVDTAVTCDAACFTAMGFKFGQALKVRDLWAGKDLPSVTVADDVKFTPAFDGNAEGGCSMVTFTAPR